MSISALEPCEDWVHGGQRTSHLPAAVVSGTRRWSTEAGREWRRNTPTLVFLTPLIACWHLPLSKPNRKPGVWEALSTAHMAQLSGQRVRADWI